MVAGEVGAEPGDPHRQLQQSPDANAVTEDSSRVRSFWAVIGIGSCIAKTPGCGRRECRLSMAAHA